MAPRLSPRDALIERAKTANQESKLLDFKGQFEDSTECWCGLVKDIVAMANTGGGILVFGANSDGTPTGFNCNALLSCDIANITNKIFKYTGFHFGEIEIALVQRGDGAYPALIVGETDIPTPFSSPGEFVDAAGNKKSAFAKGTVYFRHGSKSEPAYRADLAQWIARHSDAERRRLMQGVKKVWGAPPGHVISVTATQGFVGTGATGMAARLSADPDATKITPRKASDFHPHRGKELLQLANKKLKPKKISPFDITCINHSINIFSDHPEFATKPHDTVSPLYSDNYLDWLVKQIGEVPNFLANARLEYIEAQRAKAKERKRKKK